MAYISVYPPDIQSPFSRKSNSGFSGVLLNVVIVGCVIVTWGREFHNTEKIANVICEGPLISNEIE